MKEEQSQYEHYSFTAEKGQNPLRVDKFLMNFIENATRSKVQAAIKQGNVLVDGNIVKANYKVKADEVVSVVLSFPPRDKTILGEDIPLDIVFEDDSVIVVNKSAGMVVHPGHGNYTGTLVNAMVHHCDNLPKNKNSMDRPGLVHRIDKGTSGLLVFAKTETAMSFLTKQFFDKTTKRKYVAIVWGDVKEDSGTVVGSIGRNPKNRLQMSVFEEGEEGGKHAVTHYKVLKRFGYVTVVECQLETGRTHQIRVHMKHIGHTIFNDERYGGDKILKGTTFTKYRQFVDNCFSLMPRPALHARTLGFVHPVSLKEMVFECPIPDDINGVLAKWEVYSNIKN